MRNFKIFRDAFRIFDRNKDGYIDMAELRKMFAMVGGLFSKDDMEEFMNEADKDGNGKIDYEEFIRMLKQFD